MRKTQNSASKNKKTNVIPDDKIDELIEKIQMQKPRNGFTHFVMEEIEKVQKKKKFDIAKDMQPIREKWNSLDDKKKAAYNEMFLKEKEQYAKDLEAVRVFLFHGVNQQNKTAPTAYRVFVNEKIQEGFENDENIKEVKEKAKNEWAVMPLDKKQQYVEKKKVNDQWFEKCKHLGKVNPLTVFLTKTFEKLKAEGKELPKVPEIAAQWKSLSKSEKEKYARYADELNEEKKKLKDLYELTRGVRPSRPVGAFKIFLQEKSSGKEIHSIKEGVELWKKLSENEKQEYQKKAHKYVLAYRYKKLIYEKKIKKDYPKRPLTVFAYFMKDFKHKKVPGKDIGERMEYMRAKFEKLDKKTLRQYEEKREQAKLVYAKKVEEFQNRVYDMPKKPMSAYRIFMKERIVELMKGKKGKSVTEFIGKVADEWKNDKIVDQEKYEKLAKKDKERYIKQLKSFNKLGYYLQSEQKVEKTTTTKKKTQSKSQKKSQKRKTQKSTQKSQRSKSAKKSQKKKSQK